MKHLLIVSLLVVVSPPVMVVDAAQDTEEQAHELLKKALPGITIDAVRRAPIDDFYEVTVGNRIVYMSEDGKFLFLGDLVDTEKRVNLSEQRRAEVTTALLDAVGKDEMIVIGPADPKRYVTVFTDVDCPFCARFHRDIPTLNDAGLEVRYLLFPRTGVASSSYDRAVSVWCADDQINAMGVAKAGGKVAPKKCDNPVQEHMRLAREVGITGTPLIVLDTGRLIRGYVPPTRLLPELGLKPSTN